MPLLTAAQLHALHQHIIDVRLDGSISAEGAAGMHRCLDDMQALADVSYDRHRTAVFQATHPLHRPARLLADLWLHGAHLVPWMQGIAARGQRPCPRTDSALRGAVAVLAQPLSDVQFQRAELELFWRASDPAHPRWREDLRVVMKICRSEI